MAKRDIEKAARVIKAARITGVSERYVNMVINDERKNDTVLETYIDLEKAESEFENILIQAVRELVPLPSFNRLNTI